MLNRFTTLLDDHRKDFQAIYDLLTDQDATTAAVKLFASAVNVGSGEELRVSLAKFEVEHDFNHEVISAVGQLSPAEFLGYLAVGKPIDDLAFSGKKHGRSTHRVQWMMIALWNDDAKTLKTKVADLYKTLGGASGHAQQTLFFGGGGGTPYLWNDLVDAEDIENATCPEHFCSTLVQEVNEALYKAML